VVVTQVAVVVALLTGAGGLSGEIAVLALERFRPNPRSDLYAALRPPYLPLPRGIARVPNQLLLAAYGVAPFRGRIAEKEGLLDWCQSTPAAAVVLVTGPGGSGKTRLAAEICQARKSVGWVAGFLKDDATTDLSDLLETTNPVLVAVDYAETRIEQVLGLIKSLAAERSPRPWRVLLVARDVGDWWPQIATRTHDMATGSLLASAGHYTLGPIETGEQAQRDALAEAMRQFGAVLGLAIEELEVPDLPRSGFDRPLYLQMAALSAVCSQQTETNAPHQHVTEASLVRDAMQREQRYWRESARQAHLAIDDHVAARAVAVATLTIAHNEDEAEAALRAVPELGDESQTTRRRVADWLYTLYPGERDEWFKPLEPDLLGETNVAAVLTQAPSIASRLVAGSRPVQMKRALTIMTRAAQRERSVRSSLESAIAANLEAVWLAAVDVAEETGDPLGEILTVVIKRDPRPAIMGPLLFRLPQSTVSLRALGEFATRAALEVVRRGSQDPDLIATLLNNLSNHLSHMGRLDEALSAIREAVDIRRSLAAADGTSPRSDLAGTLSNLARCLSALGHREEALTAATEAVDIHRALAAAHPEAFRSQLATSLSGLSICLLELGRHEEAKAAGYAEVRLRRVLAAGDPGVFRPGLARSLSNYSRCLSKLGRSDEALAAIGESVDIYRELADARPDAFGPDLAASLVNLATGLAENGRQEEALVAITDAVGGYRILASAYPDAFLSPLGTSLVGLSNRLAALGCPEDSLPVIREAVGTYRTLTASHPDAYQAQLATSLNNLSAQLAALGRGEEALPAITEAVEIRRALASAYPEAFRLDLARSLRNLSGCFAVLGRPQQASAAAGEAEELESPRPRTE
jgi:tetratricopeptide (TPR) repeat protein